METSIFAFPTDLLGEGRRARPRQRPGTGGRSAASRSRPSITPAGTSSRTTLAGRALPRERRLLFPRPTRSLPRPGRSSRASAGWSPTTTRWPAPRGLRRRAGLGVARVDGVPPLSTGPGRAAPSTPRANAFGDPMLTELCPANPDVAAYVRALSADIARRGVQTIVAESLHYHPLEHGYHHERYFLHLGARTQFPARPLLLRALPRGVAGGRGRR